MVQTLTSEPPAAPLMITIEDRVRMKQTDEFTIFLLLFFPSGLLVLDRLCDVVKSTGFLEIQEAVMV